MSALPYKIPRPMPAWFGRTITAAMHQDTIASWPLWKQIAHRLFVSHRCPCCIAWKSRNKPNAPTP